MTTTAETVTEIKEGKRLHYTTKGSYFFLLYVERYGGQVLYPEKTVKYGIYLVLSIHTIAWKLESRSLVPAAENRQVHK